MAGQHVVWRSSGRGAGGLANTDGDGLTVRQGYHDWRASHWRADGCGVDDIAAFSGSGGRGQFHRGGVDGVGDAGHSRRRARHQVLEVTTGGGADRRLHGAGVLVDVVSRGWDGHGASGFTGIDGDHCAVRQGDGHWRASGVGQGRGVNDRAAFSHRASRAQRQVRGVDGVSHGGADRSFVGNKVLVVAAGHVGDRVGQWRMTGQCIVWRCGGCSARGLANTDGDGLTIGQSHDNRRAGNRCAYGSGVDNVAAFSRCTGRGQFHRGGVDSVRDAGHGRRRARHQVLEVATGGVADRRLHGAGVFVDVVGRGWNGHGASGFAGLDGDHGAVAQRHGHWRASRVGQRCGVNNRTTLGHCPCGAERQVSGVDGVGHGGADRSFVGNKVFVVAAGHVGDRVGQWRMAGQRIIWCGEGHGAGGFADFDGDVLTIGQRHGDR